jgi:hypothetical protein
MSKLGNPQHARVFISCGQQKETSEERIALQLAEELKKLGYEPYIAVAEQSLRGVQENIFRRLSESEYLIFIDFKREKLESGYHRGSLFSHQELALATYLGIEILAFREEGVLSEDGILRFLQANCIPFTDRRHLADIIIRRLERDSNWDPSWRNGLSVERTDQDFEDIPNTRFFHIRVRNNHRNKIAHDCSVYLTQLVDHTRNITRELELLEFKWKGVNTASVAIPQRRVRSLDAFKVELNDPTLVRLGLNGNIVDRASSFNDYTIRGPGIFDLHFTVFSDNLPPCEGVFRLSIAERVEDLKFTQNPAPAADG